MDMNGSVIAITGAGGGLGQTMAIELAKAGASLALLDLDSRSLEETQALCAASQARVYLYPMDVTDEQQVEQTFDAIVRDLGQLDGLVNNAGILRDAMLVKVKGEEVSKMSLAQFNSVISVNLTGTFLCGREAALKMIETKRKGVIINISSVSRAGNMGQSNYSASKAGVASLATCWAKELGRYGIRAAAIAPGVVKTAMTDQMKPEAIARLENMVPLGRIAQADEIAHAVKFIFESDYYTGRVLELDGGLRL
ncbi:SDR family oxidoreductase [Vibrio sinensis]|uniref:SDR family oxidoreductase n=1 Tax=Vibrio sinensis TaxID=2302434 RepID=A0A3A6R3D0_9VIBR|nr:SDR family oxidoreductase [Vibrio sinensis]RJX75409.1 SDR family oxidoreductase [Vibrio sinensis]